MFDIADSLQPALARSDESLRQAQYAVANANAGRGGGRADAAMAQAARAAVFDEALLGAMHARLAELKTVTK